MYFTIGQKAALLGKFEKVTTGTKFLSAQVTLSILELALENLDQHNINRVLVYHEKRNACTVGAIKVGILSLSDDEKSLQETCKMEEGRFTFTDVLHDVIKILAHNQYCLQDSHQVVIKTLIRDQESFVIHFSAPVVIGSDEELG